MMGVYIYTLKSPKRRILTDDGVAFVQHFSYAYKPSWSIFPNPKYERYVGQVHAHAERAYEKYDNGYIVFNDYKEDGKLTDLRGARVYNNLKVASGEDYDLEELATYVGYLVKKGRSYHLIKSVTVEDDGEFIITKEYYPPDRWTGAQYKVIKKNKETEKETVSWENTEEVTA